MAYPENASYRNKPVWLDRAVAAENAPSNAASRALKDAMDSQGREALDISDTVPRRAEENRADGGAMTNAKLAQVDRDFEPAAAQDAREAAATRSSMRRVNSPLKPLESAEPPARSFLGHVSDALSSPEAKEENFQGCRPVDRFQARRPDLRT